MKSSDSFFSIELLDEIHLQGLPGPAPLIVHSVIKDKNSNFFYISDEFNHRVLVIDGAGNYVKAIGKRGNGPCEFWYPTGLTLLESKGQTQLVVCDRWNHRLQMFSLEGDLLGGFGSIGNGLDSFDEPIAVAQAGEGRMWVLDRCNHRVKLCDVNGHVYSMFGKRQKSDEEQSIDTFFKPAGVPAVPDAGLLYPQAFTIDQNGLLLICDTNNCRIVVADSEGKVHHSITLCKNDKGYYRYPMTITSIPGNMALIGIFNQHPMLINIEKPWMHGFINFDFFETDCSVPVLFEKEETGGIAILAFDSNKKVIKRFRLIISDSIERAFSLSLSEIESTKQSINWKDILEGYFREVLKSGETEATANALKAIAKLCVGKAHEEAEHLAQLEDVYCRSIIDYYQLHEKEKALKSQGRVDNDITQEVQRRRLESIKELGKRRKLKNSLAQYLGWACRALTSFSLNFQNRYLASDREELFKLLKIEYASRQSDFNKIKKWLDETVSKSKDFDIVAGSHACLLLLFLQDHLQYLKEALSMFADESEWSSDYYPRALPWSFNTLNPEMLPDFVEATLGDLSEFWEMHDTFIAFYSKVMEYSKSPRPDILLRVGNSYRKKEEYEEAEKCFKKCIEIDNSPLFTVNLASFYQGIGNIAGSEKVIAKYSQSGLKDPACSTNWATAIKRQKLITGPYPRLKLTKKQSVLEATTKTFSPKLGGNLCYIETILLHHPITGRLINPTFVEIVSATELLISDFRNQELFVFDLNTGLRLLLNHHMQITGMAVLPGKKVFLISHDEIRISQWYSKNPQFKVIDLNTSQVIRIPRDNQLSLLRCPLRAALTQTGEVIVTDMKPGCFWVLGSNFSQCEKIDVKFPIELKSNANCITVCNNIFVSFPSDNAIFEIDLAKRELRSVDIDHCVHPTYMVSGKDGELYVSSPRGLGIQVYAPGEGLLYMIESCSDENSEYKLDQQCYLIRGSDSFNGNDFIIADESNGAVHFFQT